MGALMAKDCYGNPLTPGLPYARGRILADTADDVAKLRTAWRAIRARIAESGASAVHNISGLDRALHCDPEDLFLMDDELAPALHGDQVAALGLEHLGGRAPAHDIALLNRVTAGIVAVMLVGAEAGDGVAGLSARYSHPCIQRAARRAGASFTDTTTLEAFAALFEASHPPRVAAITRLTVTYEVLPAEVVRQAVAIAQAAGALVLLDDAGGARVGPAVFDQPRSLELGVDVAVTGLDKYGTIGPRLDQLGGKTALVGRIRALAFELGLEARPMLYPAVVRSLEAYDPERVRAMAQATAAVGDALARRLGNRVFRTAVSIQVPGEDVLGIALERAGIGETPIVPYEATAALAMLLLRDHGMMTVHFAGLPPGTDALLLKFLPLEAIERLGGPEGVARRIDDSLDTLAALLSTPAALRALLVDQRQGHENRPTDE